MQLLRIVICSVLYYATYKDYSLFIWFSLQLYIFFLKERSKQTALFILETVLLGSPGWSGICNLISPIWESWIIDLCHQPTDMINSPHVRGD